MRLLENDGGDLNNMNGPFSDLFGNQKRYRFAKGQILIMPGEEPRGVFYVRKGYVKAYAISPLGEYQIVVISGPGDIVPLYWALSVEPRQLFFETMCTAEVSVMPRDIFRQKIADEPALLKEALAVVLGAFRYSLERIQNLELKTAHERIAFRLLFLAHYYGRKENNSVVIEAPSTYQDIAESLNLTRETVNRIIGEYVSDKLVRRSAQGIRLLDIPALKSIINDDVALDF